MNTYTIDGFEITSPDPLTEEEQRQVLEMYKKDEESSSQPDINRKDSVLKANEYDSLFEEVGKKHDINPQILKAIAQQESNFDPLAEGADGEIGMMKLMPIIRNEYGVKDPTDPRQNVVGAARFLDDLLKKYDNDLNKTLEAYNGGETLVDKQGGSVQTRDYRDSVISIITNNTTPSLQTPKERIEGISNLPESANIVPDEELTLKYDELYENDEYFAHVEDFMIARFGKQGNLEANETRKDYIRRFANHMRHVEYNNIDLAQELLWTNSASEEDRTRAGYAFTLWDSIPIFDGGYNKFEAFADFGQALVTDATTYFGLGAGKVASMVAAKGALNRAKAILKEEAVSKKLKDGFTSTPKSRALKKESKKNIDSLKKDLDLYKNRVKRRAMYAGAAIEGTIGAYSGGMKENLAILQYRKETFDYTNVALEGAVGTLFGGLSTRFDVADSITSIPGVDKLTDKKQIGFLSKLDKKFTFKELDQSEKIIKDFESKLKAGKSPNISKTLSKEERAVSELLSKSDKELSEFYEYTDEAKQIFEKYSPQQKEIFETQVRTKLYPIAVKIGGHIMLNNIKEFGPQMQMRFRVLKKGGKKSFGTFANRGDAEQFIRGRGEKDFFIQTDSVQEGIGQAVNRVIKNLMENKIDALDIEQAATQAGISADEYAKRVQTDLIDALKQYDIKPEDMEKLMGASLSDSAKKMQPYSYVSKIYNNMVGKDPESMKFIETLTKREYHPGFQSRIGQGFLNLERESKVWVTSALSTTTANIQGTLSQATFGTAARGFELMFNKFMRGIGTTLGADPKVMSIPEVTNVGDVFKEWVKMVDYGMTSLEVDEILKFNPSIRDTLTNTLITGPVDKSQISRFGRFLSTLNIAVDSFSRKSFFAASVERQLNSVGKNLHTDFLDKGVPIPKDILKKATDDAMRATFTYQFKNLGFKNGKNFSFETAGNTIAHVLVKGIENLPTGSIIGTPFPRFIASGLNSLYRYSPVGGVSGIQDMTTALTKKNMDLAKRQALYNNGLRAFSQGMVGFSIIAAFGLQRKFDREAALDEMTNEEGDVFKITNVFPMAQYSALGELFYISFMRDEKEKVPSRSTLDQTIKLLTAIEPQRYGGYPILGNFARLLEEGMTTEEVTKILARGAADFLGRFPQPIKPVKEFFEGMSAEGFISRDPKDIPFDVLLDSDTNLLAKHLNNQFKNKLPPHLLGNMYGKEQLEEAVQYFKYGPPSTAGGFLTNFLGVKLSAPKSKIEKEIIRLGMQPWQEYTPTGIKTYDNLIISNSMAYIDRQLLPIIESDRYKNSSTEQQINNLKRAISDLFRMTKENFKRTGVDLRTGERVSKNIIRTMDYIAFRQLGKRDRTIIANAYEDKYGESLDDTKEYEKALIEFRGLTKPGYIFETPN